MGKGKEGGGAANGPKVGRRGATKPSWTPPITGGGGESARGWWGPARIKAISRETELDLTNHRWRKGGGLPPPAVGGVQLRFGPTGYI